MNHFNIRLLFASCILLLTSGLVAQTTVTGVVYETENMTVPGATILVKGTTNGTFSEMDGTYSLEVNSLYDTLEVSYIGFQTKVIPLNGNATMDIYMNVQNTELEEIVVIGYGRQKKKVVTGAIASVSDEDINSTPTLRVEQALQGRTAGVQVTNQSGQPGDEPTVRIRGIGTTGNANPLYIVDGLPVSGIDYLNPGDIKSIDVLKDAASAAIYGARAANGVVLITTKTGSKGKLSIGYDGYYGVQNVGKRLEMLNADEYKMIMNEGARNSGLTEPFDLNEISEHDTDWQEELFTSNAPIQNHQLSITGGNEKSVFASSLSYFTQEGIIGGAKSQFDRYTARLNSKHKVNRIFSFGNNLAYTHLIKKGIDANASFNGAYSSALNLDPLTPIYETDENVLNSYPYNSEPVVTDSEGRTYGISNYIGAEIVNPFGLLEIDNDKTRKDQLVGNVYGELEPIKNLKFKTSLGVDLAYVMDDGFKPLFYLNGAQLNDEKTSVNKSIKRYFTWQWENTAYYEKQIGDHKIDGLAGITAQEFKFEDLSGFNAKVPVDDPDHVYLDQAQDTVWKSTGNAYESALYSLFARANYNFRSKYSFTAILRRDGSSKFGSNRRFGLFPSFGVSWVASDEAFMLGLPTVDYLKFRASWGVNGNQEIGDYQFVSTIDNTRGYTFGGGREVGSSPSYVENADIHWEESEQLDIGVDLGFFNNRLQATFDYYVKNTRDLLETIPIPGHVGNVGPVSNVGSVQNKGIEYAVSWRNSSSTLNYSVGINGAFNVNTMTKIGNAEKVINGASWAIAGTITRSEEGLPIAYFWGYETDGLFQNQSEVFQYINADGELLQPNAVPGDVRFVDSNGDGIINEDDRTNIGNPTPDMTFGFNAAADYKGFDVSLFLQGSYGNDVFNGTQRQDLRYTNRTTAILDRWTGEGTSTTVPRYSWVDVNNNYRVSDLYVEDGSYMRLKNIQFGYSLPEALMQRLGAEKWRFYISGENLWTLTKYTGVDPEIGALSSFDIGIDRAVYPLSRTFRFGTSVTF